MTSRTRGTLSAMVSTAIIFGERGARCSFLLILLVFAPQPQIQVLQRKIASRNDETLLSHCIPKSGFYTHHRATDSQTPLHPT